MKRQESRPTGSRKIPVLLRDAPRPSVWALPEQKVVQIRGAQGSGLGVKGSKPAFLSPGGTKDAWHWDQILSTSVFVLRASFFIQRLGITLGEGRQKSG